MREKKIPGSWDFQMSFRMRQRVSMRRLGFRSACLLESNSVYSGGNSRKRIGIF